MDFLSFQFLQLRSKGNCLSVKKKKKKAHAELNVSNLTINEWSSKEQANS